MKFLIDECLSPELAQMAWERGHGESSHVVWMGHQGIKDWDLMRIVLAGDWTLATKNSFDFRGHPASPGASGRYSRSSFMPD
jgi:predicted nuclease of predicted toxin-antitoxin system